MAISDTNASSVDLSRAPLWRGVVTAAAVAFSLRTAWDLRAVVPDYERVVAREGAPPLYTLVVLAATIITVFNSYVAAAALWLRRRWAHRAIVGYGIVVTGARIGVRTYFSHGREMFSGDEWAMIASLGIVLIGASALVDRALEALPVKAAPLEVPPLAKWEFWLTIIAAVPPTLFAARMLALGVIGSGQQVEGGNLPRLAWLSLPVVFLLMKQVVDRTFSLRPDGPPPKAAANVPIVPTGPMYYTPQSVGELICEECIVRVLNAPDGVYRTLYRKGHAPAKAPPEYAIELLLFGVFVHDIVLAERGGPMDEEARTGLRGAARTAANRLMAEAERGAIASAAWEQLVDRRYIEYSADVRQADLEPANRAQHLMKMGASAVRYASKSHVPNPSGAKVLLEFFVAERERARAALSKYELVSDA